MLSFALKSLPKAAYTSHKGYPILRDKIVGVWITNDKTPPCTLTMNKIYRSLGKELRILVFNPTTQRYIGVVWYPDPFRYMGNIKPYISSSWVSASSTRNYMLDDPILDFFEMTNKSRGNSKTHSEDLSYLFQLGHDFEAQCFSDILERFPTEVYVVSNSNQTANPNYFETTRSALRGKVPIIYQGVLHDRKRKLFGSPDLIVRDDYLPQISPSLKVDSNGYSIVDIKFHKINLMKDGLAILNDATIRAFKAQLCIYTHLLGDILGFSIFKAYIIGRGSSHGSHRIVDPFARLGVVDFKGVDYPLIEQTALAIEWKRSCNEGKAKRPSPNMKNSYDDQYHHKKMLIAEETKDLTLLCYVGPVGRDLAHKAGFYSYDQPGLTAEIMGLRGKPAYECNLLLSGIHQRESVRVSPLAKKHLPLHKCEVYIDFETYFDFELDITIPYFLGMGIVVNGKWEYKHFMLKSLDKLKEYYLEIFTFFTWLSQKYPDVVYYEWTGVEHRLLETIFEGIGPLKINVIDMHCFCKSFDFVVKGMLGYGLKAIGKALYRNGMTIVEWKDTDNQMFGASRYYREQKPMKMIELLYYNEIDCKMVYEIVRTIRSN